MTDEQKQDMQYLEQITHFNSADSNVKQWNEWRMSKGVTLCKKIRDMNLSGKFRHRRKH